MKLITIECPVCHRAGKASLGAEEPPETERVSLVCERCIQDPRCRRLPSMPVFLGADGRLLAVFVLEPMEDPKW